MGKSLTLTYVSSLLFRPRSMITSSTRVISLSLPKPIDNTLFSLSPSSLFFSTTSTQFPLQYDMIINRPTQSQPRHTPARVRKSNPDYSPEFDSPEKPVSEQGFEDWVDEKLLSESTTNRPSSEKLEMDKSMRKYYNKRRKRMYGSDSDSDSKRHEEGFVELKPEVVEFNRLHEREEELYFYDTFAYPWEKEKHYKMVYQLEKKYFPDHCLDKAFLEPGESNANNAKGKVKKKVGVKSGEKNGGDGGEGGDSKKLVFFDEEGEQKGREEIAKKDASKDVTEKKVEEFFKCLNKVPKKNGEVVNGEPYLVTRSMELPPRWDSPCGTVILVNKPKGWTSFTVCGKLRRLVKVKKVGHAGTLDPMATGLLIVCVGKATKLVERYQGMIKGYSGVFRLGEATSTWDADSPVIQRELWEHIKDEEIKKTAASFCGEIWQVPPMFSAIKVGGEKMYEKARRGESIELSPRRISIFRFDIERSLDDRQNLIFRVTCSKGTYIRSLCADFGKALGSCAHLTALRRDSIGEYSADDAWDFKELEESITKSYF
ncbi:hypothetical protein I3760_04G028900 [Carya illinoinensis]|uniref:tRNA pseudouridine(55) synthase n=1 Tax=Carya illinoinensis TaxID=32201 RepID=A0A8T1QR09_CARIL|nr:uncharacterized protein LOC122307182 [Carya illinoinensis]KAG2710470.1 hypothetical protein I3760_04G028900 [Carya illinoinensis]KAG6656544.1 hypothetical protein CIPAW_04G029800 [Carya illinoinensis]